MGGKSSSSSASTSNITDRRIGATDNAIVAAEGANIQIGDYGAVAAGTRIAENSLVAGNNLARSAIGSNVAVTEAAFNFGNNALKTVENVTDRSLDSVDRSLERSLLFAGESLEEFTGTLRDINAQALKNVDTANKSLLDVSEHAITKVEASTRSDAAQSFNQLLKTTAVIGVAVAAATVLKKG